MSDTLVVNEIYLSLQGESTWAGLPCIFIRLTACNLRCSYCDTAYAFTEGRRRTRAEILAEVDRLALPYRAANGDADDRRDPEHPTSSTAHPTSIASAFPEPDRLPVVELTGGEPLLQAGALPLMTDLCDRGYTVLIETSGALDISRVDRRVHRIMDLKCPSSGEVGRNLWSNLDHLRPSDEVKFVIGSREDYLWARRTIADHRLAGRCPLLFSWVHPLTDDQRHPSLERPPEGQTPITRRELVEAIIADALPVRFQAQLHKIIWPPEQRGV